VSQCLFGFVFNIYSGVVKTLAGSGVAGFADGVGTAAIFSNPRGVAISFKDILYSADYVGCHVRIINSAGEVETLEIFSLSLSGSHYVTL
jgi:hypothetical protein